jgi:hypothetical protein
MSGLTEGWLLSTRETVPTATPADWATSRMVRAPDLFLLRSMFGVPGPEPLVELTLGKSDPKLRNMKRFSDTFKAGPCGLANR